MKTKIAIASIALQLGLSLGYAQSFTNLNFESASVPADQQTGSSIPFSSALPGWFGFYGTTPVNSVVYNTISIGSVNIALVSTNGVGASSLQGRFSVVLQGGLGSSMEPVMASISQTALVPFSTESLMFRGQPDFFGQFSVSLGGQNLQLVSLSSGPNYTLFGSDITPFAGQTTELRFTAIPGPNGELSNLNLDSIVFSTQPIPEPSSITLLAVGGASLLGWHWWKKRKMRRNNSANSR